jgi:hypothetical protein
MSLAQCKRLADKVERQLTDLVDKDTEAALRRWLVDVALVLTRG